MTFELFLSGEVIAALLRISFLGAYSGRAMIVIFCHNFCFADSISWLIRTFGIINVYDWVYRTFWLMQPTDSGDTFWNGPDGHLWNSLPKRKLSRENKEANVIIIGKSCKIEKKISVLKQLFYHSASLVSRRFMSHSLGNTVPFHSIRQASWPVTDLPKFWFRQTPKVAVTWRNFSAVYRRRPRKFMHTGLSRKIFSAGPS